MKKLLALLIALMSVFAASAQPFHSENFLNVVSINVTNTGAFTNLASFFGQNSIWTTNAQLLSYTNSIGTGVFDWQSNTNSGPTPVSTTNAFGVVTNVYINWTNDQTVLVHDAPFHSDGIGNVCTNYNLSFSVIGGTTVTNDIQVTFIPIIKGGSYANGANVGVIPPAQGSGGVKTVLDTNSTFTINVPVTRGAATSQAFYLGTYMTNGFAGYSGLRCYIIQSTNAAGSAIVADISLDTFVP